MSIADIVAGIEPFDALESEHRADVLAWIDSGAPLYRIAKPDNPPKHLVSYFVVFDKVQNKLLLIDHYKAKAWLPTGGHVEIDEDPAAAVVREAREELEIEAHFAPVAGDRPLFITVTQTRGEGTHTDVSLWYVIEGDATQNVNHDGSEFDRYQWLTFDEILAMKPAETDPHMHRFVRKLQTALAD